MSDVTDRPELTLPDSPVGRQMAWFLEHSLSKGQNLTVEEIAEHMAFPSPWSPEHSLARFREDDARPFRIEKLSEASPFSLDVTFDYGDDKPWKASFTVEEAEPHRIVRMFWTRAIPDDIVIRPAVPSDGAALNDLEVRAPMQLGETTVTYDRGEDFLAFSRLMGDNICFVTERDGELLGLACGTTHPVRIGGTDYRVMLLHHLRVPVEHRKGGIFSTLNGNVFGAFEGRSDGAYGYTALDNAEGMRIGGPGTWSVAVFRTVLDCAALAGPTIGRQATPADAAEIVDILNRGHDGEEMYLPYTVESFSARMERAPDLYTWDHVLVGDGAVVGVWPAGLTVTVDDGGHPVRTTRAVVLDHGFAPSAAGGFEQLLRASCGRLLDLGHTEMAFLTSEGSPSYPLVSKLARRIDAFSFRMAVPEPEGTKERGLYVDAIYF
jgi:hypothetical protein